jgi:hypothetical protein
MKLSRKLFVVGALIPLAACQSTNPAKEKNALEATSEVQSTASSMKYSAEALLSVFVPYSKVQMAKHKRAHRDVAQAQVVEKAVMLLIRESIAHASAEAGAVAGAQLVSKNVSKSLGVSLLTAVDKSVSASAAKEMSSDDLVIALESRLGNMSDDEIPGVISKVANASDKNVLIGFWKKAIAQQKKALSSKSNAYDGTGAGKVSSGNLLGEVSGESVSLFPFLRYLGPTKSAEYTALIKKLTLELENGSRPQTVVAAELLKVKEAAANELKAMKAGKNDPAVQNFLNAYFAGRKKLDAMNAQIIAFEKEVISHLTEPTEIAKNQEFFSIMRTGAELLYMNSLEKSAAGITEGITLFNPNCINIFESSEVQATYRELFARLNNLVEKAVKGRGKGCRINGPILFGSFWALQRDFLKVSPDGILARLSAMSSSCGTFPKQSVTALNAANASFEKFIAAGNDPTNFNLTEAKKYGFTEAVEPASECGGK